MATEWQRKLGEPKPEPLVDVFLGLTSRLRDAGAEVDAIVAELPSGWKAASRAVNEARDDRHYGVNAALRIALAYCDWWDHMDHSTELPTHTNLEQHHAVALLRSRITALLQRWSPESKRGRGQPRRRAVDSWTLQKIKAEYDQRRRAAPAGGDREVLRREIIKTLAREYGYPNAKALRDQLFRK